MLRQLLADKPAAMPFAQLLVGTESSDDAAVWQVDERTCVIATTDFFMPVVDDPYDFGRIAAANALSDVYAMGGKPIMALAILGMPLDKLDIDTVRAILAGGESICAEAGIPVAGGHSIDSGRTDLWPRGDRLVHARQRAPKHGRASGRRADPDQGHRCRHLFGGVQEAGTAGRRVCGNAGVHHAAQQRRP